MKKTKFAILVVAIIFATGTLNSCKSKNSEKTDTSTATVVDTPSTVTPAPVEISNDDVLKKGVSDAVKDYPNVKADVTDGVVTLTGDIKRADWQKLNPTLNTLHPKSVNSTNLTIK